MAFAATASANTGVSSDPYTNATSEHATQVEPDTFANGSMIVGAFQSGRFSDGGSSGIGWATSTNGGSSWTGGFLPGITKFGSDASGDNPGPYDRATDPSVAYDSNHGVWLIVSLALNQNRNKVTGVAVLVSRSTDGTTWSNPVTVATNAGGQDLDKTWIACDNHTPGVTDPYAGNCYVTFDDFRHGDRLKMTTSTDGGLHWGPVRNTANNATGLGGQPVVQPNGTVIVPAANAYETAIIAFKSTNGGASWSATNTVASASSHAPAGGLRSGPLPSAEADANGKVYVAWEDCRFHTRCSRNDIVLSSSTDGTSWTTPVGVPDADTTNNPSPDHFIPGLAVDPSTSGSSAHLGLTYYYYPTASCSAATCQLDVGYVSSANGGADWSGPSQLAGSMALGWLASTNQGPMVGDYISTSFTSDGLAHPLFASANAPSGTTLDEAMYAPSAGLAATGGSNPTISATSAVITPSGAHAIPDVAAERAAPRAPVTHR